VFYCRKKPCTILYIPFSSYETCDFQFFPRNDVFLLAVMVSHRTSEFQPQTIDFFTYKKVKLSHQIDLTFLCCSTNIIFEFQITVLVSQLPYFCKISFSKLSLNNINPLQNY